MKIVIRFKSGFELLVTCEKAVFDRNGLTGKLQGYELEGIKDNKSLFFRFEDVECIYRIMNEENEE